VRLQRTNPQNTAAQLTNALLVLHPRHTHPPSANRRNCAGVPTSARRFVDRMPTVTRNSSFNIRDARFWQIGSLSLLLIYGIAQLRFDQDPVSVALILEAALLTQFVCGYAVGLEKFDPLSPLITGLSLSILLRASDPQWLAFAAMIAITSKFVIRINGKHIFNPANFALGVMLLGTDVAWISPAQWGSATWAAFLFLSLATLVLSRARRGDIAIAFLVTFIAILFGRALYLGDPWAIPLKQMQSGGLLLFAFFMISDPKTTPDTRAMRILYAVIVASVAAYIQIALYRPQGLIFALFFLTPLVSVLDQLSRRKPHMPRFEWSKPVIN
jgi:enediyne biosynthesis protein E5